MRLLLFSDIHLNLTAAQSIVDRAAGFDVIVGAGDFGTKRQGLPGVIDVLAAIEQPTVVVPGNAESDDELRAACGRWTSAHVLHGEGVQIDGVDFYGLGAAVPETPFGDWSFDLSEAAAERMLAGCPSGGVLVSHSPPHGHVDIANDRHLGSTAVLAAVERVVPRLVVCGHVHSGWEQRSAVGETVVLNAGPNGVAYEL